MGEINAEVWTEVGSLGVRKSELENDMFRVREFLGKHLPKNLAEAVFKYARKDLDVKGAFRLKPT